MQVLLAFENWRIQLKPVETLPLQAAKTKEKQRWKELPAAVTKNTTSVGFALEANLLAHCRVVTPSLAHVARNRNPEVGWGCQEK